jgi:hypothetical protein
MSTIAELDEAAVVISDDGLSRHAREVLSSRAGELRIVAASGRARSEAAS